MRHGQGAGNVARDAAHAAHAQRIDLSTRDADVPLSELGEEQSAALGQWMAQQPAEDRPDVILVSPYLRARQTAEGIRQMNGFSPDLGIAALHPEQTAFRKQLGKFYHRPPGGESWADVILRLRSALDTLSLHYAGKNVMIVSHQVVVLCLRYLLENLDEERILAIDRQGDVANCGLTEYTCEETADPKRSAGARMVLVRYNFTAPLAEAGTPITRMPDAKVKASGG